MLCPKPGQIVADYHLPFLSLGALYLKLELFLDAHMG